VLFGVDKSKFEIRLDGRRLDLTTTEFRLLTLLIERRGHTLSREALLSNVLKYENPLITRTVVSIRRKRLHDFSPSRIYAPQNQARKRKLAHSPRDRTTDTMPIGLQ
jgi:DNA-binding response OmpR family regulator